MNDAATTDFPFVAEMPKGEKSRRQKLVEEYYAFRKLSVEGPPFTFSCAASFLGVSRQRIYQLCESGRLERIEFLGKSFITCDGILAMQAELRKTGVHVRQFLDSTDQ